MCDLIVPSHLWPIFRQAAYDRDEMIQYEYVKGGIRILTNLEAAKDIYKVVKKEYNRLFVPEEELP